MRHIPVKKSLGQHFLRSKTAVRQIIEAAELASGELVLEIGPGEGVLTEALLLSGVKVVALEADARCIAALQERFKDEIKKNQLILLEGDIRDEDIHRELFKKNFLGSTSYKLVANIPYYITGMLFRLFLERLRKPSHIVFLVQKEVAEQIVARDKKEGILSLSVKAYGIPKYVAKVKREAFAPPPKVDSAIISIGDISQARLGKLKDEIYFRVIKAGLGAKRKMLLGNLSKELLITKERLRLIFTELDISEAARGEDVSVDKWLRLAHALAREI